MPKPLNIVVLEDSPADAELVLAEIKRAGYAVQARRVETERDYAAALTPEVDLVLADYTLPAFDGMRALQVLKASGLEIPFVLVSGSVGEELAVSLVKEGAASFVLKSRLLTLAPIVTRALEEKEARDENRRSREALQTEVETRKAIEDSIAAGILAFDPKGRIRHVNQYLCDLIGYTREELLGLAPPFPYWPPDEAEEMLRRFTADMHAGVNQSAFESRFLRRDGTLVDVSILSSPILGGGGRVDGWVRLIRDITARKQAEREKEFRAVILATQQEVSIDGLLVVDRANKVISSNRRLAEIWGIPPDLLSNGGEELSRYMAGLVADPGAFTSEIHRLQQTRERGRDEVVLKDGRVLDRYSAPMTSAEGTDYGRVWSFRDITGRKQAEARYRLIVENSHDLICVLDLQGCCLYASPSYKTVLGYEPSELVGKPAFSLARPEKAEELLQVFGESITGVQLAKEVDMLCKDGSWKTFEMAGSWINDSMGNRVQGLLVAHDLTERKEMQAQFLQSQKLETVGVLAGGVAHDFNNLLAVILSYTSLLLDDVKPGDPMHGDLREIKGAGERAAELTRQLLAFSRRQVLQPRLVDLNTIVAGTEKMLRRLIGEDVVLVTDLSAGPSKAIVDPGQIEQVLMNLAVNARDAMPRGGTLGIAIGRGAPSGTGPAKSGPGPHASIVVTDTGTGMDRATLARIFEPFFTTKAEGKGTGLGLSTVLGIVQQSGGQVEVKSEPGKGTAFSIYLPLAAPDAKAEAAKAGVVQEQGGSETVLLVEDDEQVRRLARNILAKKGYTVLEAQSGGDALLICEQHPGVIDLLLTDVVMPRMSGVQLSARLASVRPQMPVLYMSGYPDKMEPSEKLAGAGVLEKPFRPENLLARVRQTISGHGRAASD